MVSLLRITLIALLFSLLIPLVATRQRWLPALRLLGKQPRRRHAGRLAAVSALVLAMVSTPGVWGVTAIHAQTLHPQTTPTPAARPAVATNGSAQPNRLPDQSVTLNYGPTEPYYSDILAGWQSKGYRDATQTITLPILHYDESSGGTYCQAAPVTPAASGITSGVAANLKVQQVCVPASPGSGANISPAILDSQPEAANVQYCTANINATSAKQGYCVADVGGKRNALLWNNEDGSLTWRFDVAQAGLYNLQVTYYPVPGKDASIGREVLIDGKFPYLEARRVAFSRVWVDAGPVTVDNRGDEVRPGVKETRAWRTVRADDSLGMTRDPLDFYLSVGVHTLELNAVREPVALAALAFVPPLEQPTYQQALAAWQKEGLKPINNVVLTVQAEDATDRNDPTIRQETSNDPYSQPYSFGHIRLNTYGGSQWRQGGQWVEWTVGVPENGLYALTFRVNQSGNGDERVYRDIQIDGQFQYQELKEFPIPYNLFWENVCVCAAQGTPYLIHLTKGIHVIRLTDRVGPIRQTVQDLQTVVAELGYWQRRIELLTGPNPDPNLEYNLQDKFPDMIPAFRDMINKLNANVALLTRLNAGTRPDAANSLVSVADDLTRLANDPDRMASDVGDLDSYAQTLATWLLSVQQEPVWMDRFYIAGPRFQAPTAEAPLWEQGIFTMQEFLGSFIFNYTGVGSVYSEQPGHPLITVWTARGQEWALMMRELIDAYFTPQTGIYVNVDVFPPGTLGGAQSVLLLALTSGAAPDVATGVDPTTPVQFAIRGAIYPLDTMPGFKGVANDFRPGALVQFKYPASGKNSHIYALPETQDFNMLFVRTDILSALHIQPPKTWQDVYNMLPALQQNGMEFYYPTSADIQTGGFSPFLFQHGGAYYTNDGLHSALDTPQALSAFRQWTGLYTNYRVPIQASFYNRFRTGEMPAGVASFNDYISLSTAAPELIGRWQMLPMPGTRKGNIIDRAAGGSGQVVVMFTKTPHKRAAWQFIKWWLSAKTQQRYATDIEAMLGVEARWNTSNVQALRSLPWPQQDIQSVLRQWQWFRSNPSVLGGYYTPRYISFAWNQVVLSGDNPRFALDEATRQIDTELERKQIEFNVKAPSQPQYFAHATSAPPS